MRRVSGGEYKFPGCDHGDPGTRQAFLDLLEKKARAVRRSLERLRPRYEAASASAVAIDWETVRAAPPGSGLGLLNRDLTEWANSWSLNAPWMLATALQTLASPDAFPAPKWAPALEPGPRYPSGLTPFDFHFEDPGWDPTLTSREDAETRILEAVHEALNAHLNGIETRARSLGAVKTRETRGDAVRRSLGWFIDWQCGQRPKARLREEADLSAGAFDAALKRAAAALGFDVRRGRLGRPETPMPPFGP